MCPKWWGSQAWNRSWKTSEILWVASCLKCLAICVKKILQDKANVILLMPLVRSDFNNHWVYEAIKPFVIFKYLYFRGKYVYAGCDSLCWPMWALKIDPQRTLTGPVGEEILNYAKAMNHKSRASKRRDRRNFN